jgi:hypothetical protein
VSEPIPDQPDEQSDEPAGGSGATSAERAQAQAVRELSEPERLDGSHGALGPEG